MEGGGVCLKMAHRVKRRRIQHDRLLDGYQACLPGAGEHPMDIYPDYGNGRDNDAALRLALAQGEWEQGYDILRQLRDHIRTTQDIKNTLWVLPSVEAILQQCHVCQQVVQQR